jgi:hypothetical protein
MAEVKDLKVVYIMEIYKGETYLCSYETEYPKELKEQLKQSRTLDKALDYEPTYKFFIKTFKDGICSEWYRVSESEIV